MGKRVAPVPTFVYEDPYRTNTQPEKRSSIAGRRIASINDIKNGNSNDFDVNRQDTVLLGHPEAAAVYSGGEDRFDPFLGNPQAERMDSNFVSSEDIRKRSKGGY